MEKLDYKKEFKDLYLPKTTPSIIDVPQMTFIQIDGKGNPNETDGEFKKAVELLYALSYTIKMMPKSGTTPANYFEYVVPPLEGLWWFADNDQANPNDKDSYCWTAMIRQPEFVTNELFDTACELVEKKKGLATAKAGLAQFTEGLCVQCMHIGSFADEPATIERIHAFMTENNLMEDLSDTRRHHEIYLSDPRKADVAKLKTILRYPIKSNQ